MIAENIIKFKIRRIVYLYWAEVKLQHLGLERLIS